jgi:hypothetical protein
MAEIWGAAIAAGGAFLSARGRKGEKEADQEHDARMSREDARNRAGLALFEGELADYYSQLNRQRKQRGLDNIRQFSQLSRIAPEYAQVSQGIVVPDKPSIDAILPADGKDPAKPNPTTPTNTPTTKPLQLITPGG